jgi:hypothetical protein
MVKDFAAHYNAGFFLPILVASDYFGYMGYHHFYAEICHLVKFKTS